MGGNKGDYYQRLRRQIRGWLRSGGKKHKYAEYIMAAPDLFHLMCRLTFDREVPAVEKAKLAVAIAYFVSPFDLIPEALVGPVGYVDDVALAAYVLNSVIKNTSPDIVVRHWAGEGDVLELIKHILEVANKMVGMGLWRKLKGFVRK